MEDSEGKDLLNPDQEGTFNTDKMKIYYILKGKRVEIPFDISLFKGKYRLLISLNSSGGNKAILETYIEWNESDTDTIVSQISEGDCYFTSTMIKFNDITWSPKEGEYVYKIVK